MKLAQTKNGGTMEESESVMLRHVLLEDLDPLLTYS